MYLNCHSYFSLRCGVMSDENLLVLAKECGITSLALTDINNTSACLNFIRLANSVGITPLVGVDFRNNFKQQYIGIAKNNNGFLELNNFLSSHLHAKTDFPAQAPAFQDVAIIYPFEQFLTNSKNSLLPNEYIGISIKDLKKPWLIDQLAAFQDKMLMLQPVFFRSKLDFNIHRLLRSIDGNTLLSKLSTEQTEDPDFRMLPREQLLQEFHEYPFLIDTTEEFIKACGVHFTFKDERKNQNLKFILGSDKADSDQLRKLCLERLPYRYENSEDPIILSRLEKELDLINKMDYVSFFLINYEIVEYARKNDYYHVGRGSGANSIVAYLLGITNVDPIDLDLYFERFMNLFRASPPDFDIDFSWRDREDVTDFIFKEYGQNGQVALLATYNTFQKSAAIRELGKVFGLPTSEIDLLSDGKYNPEKLDHLSTLVLKYAKEMQDIELPNHLSIHAGGILISQKPIHYFTATNLPPKGFPTTQFDMHTAEDVGLYKFDILGQRGLAKIKEALTIIKHNQPDAPAIDINDVKKFIKDPQINALISQAQCIGCFYVESPAMRMLLKKLRVDNYLGLVAASSIIRPGVARSGMMREYILRHQSKERQKEALPALLELMPETYGIMVYQEDVIKVAHYFAGLTLSEADILRRGMSGKFRNRDEFQKVREKFIENCREKGYSDKTIMDVWNQIESFAGYAFAKGHSASYAVESYQSLFLKTYYPLEYMVAVLNNGGGFYHPELYVHEARMLGATVEAPCINQSWVETVIKGKTIYLGFAFLTGIEEKTCNAIAQERIHNGSFLSLDDFLDRMAITIEQVSLLLRINAFRFTGIDKRTLLWQAHFKLNHNPNKVTQNQLFKPERKQFSLPNFTISPTEEAYDQIELLGFPLCSPFSLLETKLPAYEVLVKELGRYVNQVITISGYYVAAKNTRTSKGERMNFGTFLDREGLFIDTVHFPIVAAQYPFRGRGVYTITGKVVDEFGFLSIEVIKMEKLAYVIDPRYADN